MNLQFFENPKYREFLGANHILFRAVSGEPEGDKLFSRYAVRLSPIVLVLDKNGEVIDWQCGYSPPASNEKKWLGTALLGKGT